MDSSPPWSARSKNCTSFQLIVGATALISATTTAVLVHLYRKRHQQPNIDKSSPSSSSTVETFDPLIRAPLRHTTPRDGEKSRIVYLTGIDRQTTQDELVHLFSCCVNNDSNALSTSVGQPIELDLSEVSFSKGGGRAWALYKTHIEARQVVSKLHQKPFRGCILCCRLELGVKRDGVRIVDTSSHTAVVREVQQRRGTPHRDKKNKKIKSKRENLQSVPASQDDGSYDVPFCQVVNKNGNLPVTYSHRSISVGQMEYPFPSGQYLTRLIQHLSSALKYSTMIKESAADHVLLLNLLSDTSKIAAGTMHKYTKELSEGMAMATALERTIKTVYGVSPKDLSSAESFDMIQCYCLGDGTYPVSAACIRLCLEGETNHDQSSLPNWKFVSIDPLLRINSEGKDGSSRQTGYGKFGPIECYRGYSQDYRIDRPHDDPHSSKSKEHKLSIAIACHSHAPLVEFWNRMPSPKICVTMPCCAQFSELPDETPIITYDDYEVYSPKRRIKIFTSLR